MKSISFKKTKLVRGSRKNLTNLSAVRERSIPIHEKVMRLVEYDARVNLVS